MSGGLLAGLGAASLSGAILVLMALVLRAAFQNQTPRRLFCLLWDVALARLLVLTALPSPASVWRWLPSASPAPASAMHPAVVPGTAAPVAQAVVEEAPALSLPQVNPVAIGTAIWLTVAMMLAAWFLFGHLRFRRRCADALPCKDAFIEGWLASHPLRRRVRVRTSDRVAAPLTYGALRPVILLPSAMDRADRAALSLVLEHEFQHIRRFDALRKGLLAAASCLHWFNPLVWVMDILCNRDMELTCDEAVIARGADRAGYARALLSLEEQRGRWGLSASHFSQNALKERIQFIMKRKHLSRAAWIAVVVVMSITVVAFASAAPGNDLSQAVEGDVMVLAEGGADGERQYSVDGGRTWLSEEDYRAQYGGSDWQVEWWTAEDYAAWLEEEKQALQDVIGERAYTSGEGWFTWDQKRVDDAIALYEGILENIRSGMLYSKTITDGDGAVLEDVTLAGGTDLATREERESALLAELRAFGIDGDPGSLTYNGKLVRHLVDGASASGGYAIQYLYSNPNGAVDVHTLRAAVRNPDGSYDPMGALIGVAAEGEPGFDPLLIHSAASSDAQTTAETDIGADLDAYAAFGLEYEYEQNPRGEVQLRMYWNGKPVHSLWDTAAGTWYANNLRGTELGDGALDLETVYRDGQLCGLQERASTGDGMQTAVSFASGSASDGQTFEAIFARYQPYGLTYTPTEDGMGHLDWKGQAVKSFADLRPNGGAFSYENPHVESGLRVYTEYDESGNLTGLRAE